MTDRPVKQINQFTAQTTPANGDFLLLQELSGNAYKKTTPQNIIATIGIVVDLSPQLGANLDSNGFTYEANPGSDTDIDIITVGVTGTPTFSWDESADIFSANKGLNISSGILFVGDTANTKMTQGLTIDQGANDDEILSLKSSDVDHGITTVTETDTYVLFKKFSAAIGGLLVRGLTESIVGIQVQGIATSNRTTKATNSDGAVILSASLKSGTSITNMGANANLVVIRNNNTTRWILDAEGDIFYGGVDDGNITDDYDDIALMIGMRAYMSPKGSPAKKRFNDFLNGEDDITEEVLVQQGVISAPLSEGGLVSTKGLNGLMIDGMYQLYNRLNEMQNRINILETQNA